MSYTETVASLEALANNNYEFANNYNDLELQGGVVLHKDFEIVHPTEELEAVRNRFRGKFHTQDIPSYFKYVKDRQSETGSELDRTFVNAENADRELIAKTILNFGEYSQPGHGDDQAILSLRKDPIFEAFLDNTAGRLKATDFAEVLEDFLGSVKVEAFNNGSEIGFTKAIQAIRNAKIDKNSSSTLNTGALNYEASDMEKIAIQAQEHTLPTEFVLETPIYLGLDAQKVSFRVATVFKEKENNGGIEVFYQLKPIGLLSHYLEAAEDFREKISAVLDNVSIGQYVQGK